MDDGLKPTAGWKSFDELLGKFVQQTVVNELTYRDKQRIIIIDEIVKKYLNNTERLLFRLATETTKTITDIQRIVGFHNFQTTERNIYRVFRMIKCYYNYEILDKEELKEQINKNFNRTERKIIKLLEQRYTVFEMKDMVPNMHYRKMSTMKNKILKKLQSLGGICNKYYLFLKELRQFRHLTELK